MSSSVRAFNLGDQDPAGQPLEAILPADGLGEWAREVLATGQPQHNLIFRYRRPPEQEFCLLRASFTRIEPPGEDANTACLLLLVEDFTEQEKLHGAIRESMDRYNDLVQSLDAIVWEVDVAAHKITFISRQAERILGYPVERWLNEPGFLYSITHPEEREQASEIAETSIREGHGCALEYRLVAADGSLIWLHDRVRVITDAAGQVRQLRGMAVDITEHKRARVFSKPIPLQLLADTLIELGIHPK